MLKTDIARIAQDFIKFHPLAVLATVDKNNKPWGAAVYAGSDEQFNIYFTTKSQTAKHTNITTNSSVALVFVNEQKQATLQVRGEARVVADAQEANTASNILRQISTGTEDWTPPIAKLKAGEYELYKITVNYAKLRLFGDKRKGEVPQEWEYVQ